MLNENDIEFMRSSQEEIYVLRERPITLIYTEKVHDEITGEVISEEDRTIPTVAVVTEVSTKATTGGYTVDNGVEYESGDAKFDVKKELVESVITRISRICYNDREYEVLGYDSKGIGERNRYEIVGRVIT